MTDHNETNETNETSRQPILQPAKPRPDSLL